METRKTVIAVLTAALLICAALIIGCLDPEDIIPIKPGTSGTSVDVSTFDTFETGDINYPIPEGKGVVRFRISSDSLRTILPDNSATGIPLANMTFEAQFVHRVNHDYDLSIPADIGTDAPVDKTDLDGAPIPLAVGVYDVTITAFNPAGTTAIARWTSGGAGVTLVAATNTPVTVNLEPIISGGANGTFSYGVTVPAGVPYNSSIEITLHDGTLVDTIGLTKGDPNAGTKSLAPGYYIVKVLLTQAHHITKKYVYALHIYPGMTSKMTALTGLPSTLTENEFLITFVMGGETISNSSAFTDVYVVHGNFLQAAAVADPIPAPSRSFDGWFKESTFATAWSFPTRITAATSIFAKFSTVTPPSASLMITFTISEEFDTFSADATSISLSAFAGGNFVEFTVAPPSGGGTWDEITWFIDGMDDADVAKYVDSDGVLTIENDGDFVSILVEGHTFGVNVITKIGDKTYSHDVPVEITVGP